MRNGLCECGCGTPTRLAEKTSASRGDVQGQPKRFVRGHASRSRAVVKSKYRQRLDADGKVSTLHRLRAVAALGKPLPRGAQVHHADGSRADDAPLVICQDAKYHKLLHARLRVKRAGGDPNTDKVCVSCGTVKSKRDFSNNRSNYDGLHSACKACASEQNKAYRSKERAA